LFVAVLLKLTPESWLEKIKVDKVVDENRSSETSGILAAYHKTENIKVTDLKKKGKGDDSDDDNFVAVK
jgi:hypothetical protein